jgi:hypothetical protein
MTPLTFREQCQYRFLTLWSDYTHAEAMQRIAGERLQAIVDERRNSFDVVNYRRHREAALKHTRRVKVC